MTLKEKAKDTDCCKDCQIYHLFTAP